MQYDNMKKQFKTLSLLLYVNQVTFGLTALYAFIRFVIIQEWAALITGIGVTYVSMFFFSLRVTYKKGFAQAVEDAIKRDMYKDMSRRNRRSFIRKLKKSGIFKPVK